MSDYSHHWTQGIHHDGSALYVSNPLPAYDETVTIKLRTPIDAPVKGVYMRSVPDGEIKLTTMKQTVNDTVSAWWEADLHITMRHNNYRFKIITETGEAYYYNALGISRADWPDRHDFTLLADYQAPAWVNKMVFYQIFPERFYNGDPSNDVQTGEYTRKGYSTSKVEWGELPTPWKKSRSLDFFGGDLQGITQKLDYLVELGVTALYLNPIFVSLSNHKYNIIDFDNVDPHFGGNEALAELRQALDKHGMRLILDTTPNHIGEQHPWVNEVRENPDSPLAEFFAFEEETGAMETWLGVPSLIKLNYASQELRERMYRRADSILRRWLKEPYRIDGWRLDVLNMTGNLKRDQLGLQVTAEMREAVKQDMANVYFMGEHFHDATDYLQGDTLDAIMNYQGFNIPVRRWLGGADIGVEENKPYGDSTLLPTEAMAHQWQRFMAAIPYAIAMQQFNQISTHDIARMLTVVKGDKALFKLATALMVCFPGTPCLYYGDEIGMEGGHDPDNRRCMPWDEADWDKDLLAFHKKLLRIRRESHALNQGGFQILYAEDDLIVFQRQSTEERVLFVGYRGENPMQQTIIPLRPAGIRDGVKLVDQLGETQITVQKGAILLDKLPHGTTMILKAE